MVKLVNRNQSQILSSYEYILDAVGNRIEAKEDVDIQYQYDNLYRLSKVTYPLSNVSYDYDSMGNRVDMTTTIGDMNNTINYTYDAADRLLQVGDTDYSYDNNGNLIEKNESGNITSYSYDGANRLINISTSFGSQNAISNFEYDGDGNRISKIITDNNGTRFSTYIWDVNSGLPQMLTKSDANGTTIYDYGIDLISMTDPLNGQFYYHYDGLGSVRGLSDNSGSINATYSYDAFGQPSLMTGSIDNGFLFTGEQMDTETGLIYLRQGLMIQV